MAAATIPSGVSPHSSKDALRERAVVDADAQRDAPLAAAGDERFQFAAVEAVVARVDAYLVDVLRRHGRRFGQEMDVGHEGRRIPVGTQPLGDVAQVLGFAHPLRREAQMGAPARCASIWATQAAVSRVSVLVIDLHRHGMRAADRAGADADFVSRGAGIA